MQKQPLDVQVKFACQHCGHPIEVTFANEPVTAATCDLCDKTFTVMRPAIAEEILFDWETEAIIQKLRADQSQSSNYSLLKLVVEVIELLTWRDGGNGQVEAIKRMRNWLIENDGAPLLSELIRIDMEQSRRKGNNRIDP